MAARDLDSLLLALGPDDDEVQRHLGLRALTGWVRGDASPLATRLERLDLLLARLEADPALARKVRRWWHAVCAGVDTTTLLAEQGVAQRPVFVAEFVRRTLRHVLPRTPQTRDGAELCELVLHHPDDAAWLAAIGARREARLACLLASGEDGLASMAGSTQARTDRPSRWHAALDEALACSVTQLSALGLAPDLRLRMAAEPGATAAFMHLMRDHEALRHALAATAVGPRDGNDRKDAGIRPQGAQADAVRQFLARLDDCESATEAVYAHLDEHGISVNVVFRLRQWRDRAARCRQLLAARLAPDGTGWGDLLAGIVHEGREHRSLRALVSANSSLLAARVAERSAETGEHYITRNRAEYQSMLRQAAGGGAVISVTTLLKFGLLALGLSAFWGGLAAGLNYALSFVVVQLMHWTVATKQPAMTAPAMAARLRDLRHEGAVEAFVDEVTHLVRSQVAAILGNLALVVPCVLALCGLLVPVLGHPPLGEDKAHYVLHSLAFFGPSALFAAGTGVLLFASSIVAGWVENWFVLQRLESALRHHPRITAALGVARAARWSGWLARNISGLAANVSLGLMLGLVPAFATFFGVGFDVRHVTLSAGQLAAALVTLGPATLASAGFWSCVATLALIGTLNVGVSFFLAFRVALRAHNVTGLDRQRIHGAIRARLRRAPLSFFWPAREAPPERHG